MAVGRYRNGRELDEFSFGYGLIVSFCEHVDVLSGSVKKWRMSCEVETTVNISGEIG
jgi:hypothetical protein